MYKSIICPWSFCMVDVFVCLYCFATAVLNLVLDFLVGERLLRVRQAGERRLQAWKVNVCTGRKSANDNGELFGIQNAGIVFLRLLHDRKQMYWNVVVAAMPEAARIHLSRKPYSTWSRRHDRRSAQRCPWPVVSRRHTALTPRTTYNSTIHAWEWSCSL